MKLRRLFATAAAMVLTAGIITAGGAQAATTDTTSLEVTLTGGSLAIDAPTTASGTGSVAPLTAFTVSVDTTTVSDNTGSLLGWTVTGSAVSPTFTDATGTYTLPNSNMVWTTGAIATTNGLLDGGVTVGTGGSMGAAFTVATATLGDGSGSYQYPATIAVTVPVGLKAGKYTGSVTQSVS